MLDQGIRTCHSSQDVLYDPRTVPSVSNKQKLNCDNSEGSLDFTHINANVGLCNVNSAFNCGPSPTRDRHRGKGKERTVTITAIAEVHRRIDLIENLIFRNAILKSKLPISVCAIMFYRRLASFCTIPDQANTPVSNICAKLVLRFNDPMHPTNILT